MDHTNCLQVAIKTLQFNTLKQDARHVSERPCLGPSVSRQKDRSFLASTLNPRHHYCDWQYHEHMKKCDHQWLHEHMKSMRSWEYSALLPWSKLPGTYLNAPALDPLSVCRKNGLSFNPESYTALLWLTASRTHEQYQEVWPSNINALQDVFRDAFEQPKGHPRSTRTQLQASNDIPVDEIDPNPKP